MKITLPAEINQIIAILQENGSAAYAVGGFVRDCLMGRPPSDIDIAVASEPNRIAEILSAYPDYRCDSSFAKHGTVLVICNGRCIEITAFRKDGDYSDNRRPDRVDFTLSLETDAMRRDFTINALYYNDSEGLIDVVNGSEDIKNGIIRAIGDPEKRFEEDGLRILRAFRFAAQLGFSIEENTLLAAKKCAHLLSAIANERITEELIKLIMSPHSFRAKALEAMSRAEILKNQLPRLYDSPLAKTKTLETALFIILGGKTEGLTLSAKQKQKIQTLKALSQLSPPKEKAELKRIMSTLREGEDILLLADFLEANGIDNEIEKLYNEITEKNECFNLKTLKIKGDELSCNGEKCGETLKLLLNEVIDGRVENSHSALVCRAEEIAAAERNTDGNNA